MRLSALFHAVRADSTALPFAWSRTIRSCRARLNPDLSVGGSGEGKKGRAQWGAASFALRQSTAAQARIIGGDRMPRSIHKGTTTMPDAASTPQILLVCNDLIFTSKIVGAAKALGLPIRVYPRGSGIANEALCGARLLMVDLSNSYDTDEASLRALKGNLPANAMLLAYGSHVDIDRLAGAREAGCDPVLPRSRFVEALADIMTRAAAPRPSDGNVQPGDLAAQRPS